MDFQQLLAKMQELDQPVGEECGMPPPPMNTPVAPQTPPPVPPSMSVNLNAQGMDNIEDLLKLITKVNPDMEKPAMPPLPAMGMEPSIASIKPSLPSLKMLPDLDNEPEGDHAEPDADNFGGPSDNDADNKPGLDIVKVDAMNDKGDDEEGEDDEEDKEKKDEWANSQKGSEPFTADVDAAIPDGDDLNKPKKTFPKVAGGDNPMQQVESTDLRAQIRAELLRRLNEAKSK